MADLGNNVRAVIPASKREASRAFFVEVLGCAHMRAREDLDVFTFANDCNLGLYVVADAKALTPEQQREVGTWLEVITDDAPALRARIAKSDAEIFEHADDADRSHTYVQAPGGVVFRVAPQRD